MKLKKFALGALGGLMSVALAATMLTSCGKADSGDRLVENIPTSSLMVLKFNPQQMIESAGCSVKDGKIVLSEKYSEAVKTNLGTAALGMVNSYLAFTEGVNMDAFILYVTADNGAVIVGTLSDEDVVKNRLKQLFGNQKEKNGYTVFDMDGPIVAIKDNMMWLARDLHTVEHMVESAKESNFASVGGVAKVIADDNAIAYVINLPLAQEKLKSEGTDIVAEMNKEGVPVGLSEKISDMMNYYACGWLKFEGNTASGEMYLENEAGERNQFGKAINEIDPSFLQNVPADANSIIASGNIADADIKKFIDDWSEEYKLKLSDDSIAQWFDALTLWDGTVAMAFEYNALNAIELNNLLSMSNTEIVGVVLENLKFVLMAHYPAEVIANLSAKVNDVVSQMGVTTTAVADGAYRAEIPDLFNVNFGNMNGYLTFNNYENGGNSVLIADKFAGKRFVIYSHSGVNAMAAKFGWNFSADGELWLEDDAIKFKTELVGTSANFIQAYIEPLTDPENIANLLTYFNQMSRNDYGNDMVDDYYDFE